MHEEIAMTSSFAEGGRQEITLTSSFVKDTQQEIIGMTFSFYKLIWLVVEVSDYHLIFDLNGVFVTINERVQMG
jgi:hypothetical protein